MRKNLARLCALLCAGLLLIGCAAQQTAAGIVNTEYTRENVVTQNLIGSGDAFSSAQRWACSFVEENCRAASPSHVRASFVSGFVTEAGQLADREVNAQTYDVTFDTETPVAGLSSGLDGYTVRVQAVSWQDGSGRYVLSGFACGAEIITDARQLYDFLTQDPRLTLPEFPEPSVSGGVERLNLSAALKNQNVRLLSEIYPVGKDRYFFLTQKNGAPDGTVDVRFYDAAEEKDFADHEAMHLTGVSVYYAERGGGTVSVVYNYAEGGAYYRSTFAADGTVLEIMQPAQAATRHELDGGACIVEEDGSLYLLDEEQNVRTPLLERSGEAEQTIGYRFAFAAGDRRFLYTCFGYEWVEGCGCFDLTTMRAAELAEGGAAAGCFDGRAYFVREDGMSYGMYAVPLDGGEEPVRIGGTMDVYAFSPDGKYLAYYCFPEYSATRFTRVTVVDAGTGAAVTEATVDYATGLSGLYFSDDRTLVMLGESNAVFDRWIYTLEIG